MHTTLERTSTAPAAHLSGHPSAGRQPRPAFDDLNAEYRLLEAIARRAAGNNDEQTRTLTIWARGTLDDGRVLWSGTGGAWGVIEPILAELLGWDSSSPRPVRADVVSASGRHEVLAIHQLQMVANTSDVA